MVRLVKENYIAFLAIVGLIAWAIPGGGHFIVKERKRAAIIFATVSVTFVIGLYVGSIGAIDPVGAQPWYYGQVLASPLVIVFGYITAGGGYPVYGKPSEIGQIYTCIAGLLNLLFIVNAVYLAQIRCTEADGG